MQVQVQRIGYPAALRQAQTLKAMPGMSWPAVASVMGEYHGWHRTTTWWRRELRGRVPRDPRGDAGAAMIAVRRAELEAKRAALATPDLSSHARL